MCLVPCNEAHHIRLGPAWKVKTLQGQVQGLFFMAGPPAAYAATFTVLTAAPFLFTRDIEHRPKVSRGGPSWEHSLWGGRSLVFII